MTWNTRTSPSPNWDTRVSPNPNWNGRTERIGGTFLLDKDGAYILDVSGNYIVVLSPGGSVNTSNWNERTPV